MKGINGIKSKSRFFESSSCLSNVSLIAEKFFRRFVRNTKVKIAFRNIGDDGMDSKIRSLEFIPLIKFIPDC